jgi:hypothetical protein
VESGAFLHLESFDSTRRGFGRYRFDPDARAWWFSPCKDANAAGAGTIGYADEPRVGLLDRRRVFATLHVVEGRVASFVDGRTFYWPGPANASRTTLAPFVRRFEVRERGVSLVRFEYWHDDPPGFPGALATDIFRLIAEVTRSPFSLRRFVERRQRALRR